MRFTTRHDRVLPCSQHHLYIYIYVLLIADAVVCVAGSAESGCTGTMSSSSTCSKGMSSASYAAKLGLTSLCTTGTTVSLKVSTPTNPCVGSSSSSLLQVYIVVLMIICSLESASSHASY